MNRTAQRAFAACAVIAAALVGWRLREVLAILLSATMVSTAVEPLAKRFMGRRVSRNLAIGLAYLVGLFAVLAVLVAVGRVLVAEMMTFGTDLGMVYTHARQRWQDSGFLGRILADHLPEDLRQLPTDLLHGSLLGSTAAPLHILGSTAWVLVLAVCWSFAGERVLTLTLSLFSPSRRGAARASWLAWNEATSSVLRRLLVEILALMALLLVGFQAIGLSYAAGAAVLIAAVRLLPFIGVPAALLVSGLAGAVVGPGYGLLAAGMSGLMLLAYALVVRRWSSADAHPLVVALVAMMILLGIGGLGMLLAPVVAAGLQALAITLLASTRSAARVTREPISAAR